MTLARTVVVPGMQEEYRDFAALLRTLSPDAWETPSRCEGWQVADVAAHVVGQLSDVVALRLDGLGTPEVTKRQVDERRGRSAAELADELDASLKVAGDLVAAFDDAAWEAPSPGGLAGSLGHGLEALWFDTYLHADDIRDAVGQASLRTAAITPSLSHIAAELTTQGWGPATLALDGEPTFDVDGGGGQRVTGDPLAFILAATGRADPAPLGLDPSVNIYRS
jgi:uncharacterized protein (TIGR03083 family)